MTFKCVYDSEDEPCALCRDSNLSNCLKIFKSELGRAQPSSPCDRFDFLDYTPHSNDDTSHGPDLKTLAPMLTTVDDAKSMWSRNPNPAESAVRRAISALGLRGCQRCIRDNPGVNFHNRELTRAIDDLQRSLHLGPAVRIMDLWHQALAAHLVAWLLYSTYIKETNTSVCFKMSFAALSYMVNVGRFPDPRTVWIARDPQVYTPFILDCANAWIIRNGEIVPRWTTFAQRVRYFDQFRAIADSAWYSSDLEAANSTLGNLMELGLHWLHFFAKQEAEFNFSREKIDDVLQYMRSELGDVGLQHALSALYRSSQGPNRDHSTVQGQWITRLFHRVRCVLFIHQALSADSIYLGVRDRDALTIAQKVTYHCLRQVIRRDGPIEDYFRLSWHNFSYLMLGGIGLTDDCPRRSMAPHEFLV
jgi:hypothetical protein